MGLFNQAAKALLSFARRATYGKQVGNMSRNGEIVFGKKIKGGMHYTTLNDATDEVVRTKNIFTEEGCRHGATYDEEGNIVSSFQTSTERIGCGPASRNKFSMHVRNMREEYNKYGQVVRASDVTYQPASKAGWLEIIDLEMNDRCVYVG